MALPDPRKTQWWNYPPGREQFLAYYMTLRVHYGFPAVEALNMARNNTEVLGLNKGGFMQNLRKAIRGDRVYD